jgi:hypothetical protein
MTRELDQAIDDSIASERDSRDLRKLARLVAENSDLKDRVVKLTRDLDATEQALAAATALDEANHNRDPVRPAKIKATERRAAFVLQCSDWHVGERVDPATVSGRNEYNPTIASKRVDKLILGARWMIDTLRSRSGYGWKMNEVVCWLGGDLMTGFIHDDLRETNYLSPTEELELAQDLATRLIDALAAHPGIERVTVPTSRGNHGRDTPDRRVSSGHKRSYEQLMYRQLARFYDRTNRKVHVMVSDDEITRLKVLNTTLRFTHGDQVNYAGGVGGITIPLYKWLARLDETQPADVTCIGHHHQYLDIGRCVVNNCLIGWGAYAQRVGGFKPASQVCFLVDEKFGKRMSTEIVVQS